MYSRCVSSKYPNFMNVSISVELGTLIRVLTCMICHELLGNSKITCGGSVASCPALHLCQIFADFRKQRGRDKRWMIGCNLLESHVFCHAHICHKKEAADVIGENRATIGVIKQCLYCETSMQTRCTRFRDE